MILTVALPMPLFGVLFARPFVIWISGERFAAAGPLLAILVGMATIALMNGYLFQMAVFAGAERGLWRTAAAGTVSNIAANAVAVTFWGAPGAAYVMIFSETVGLMLYRRCTKPGCRARWVVGTHSRSSSPLSGCSDLGDPSHRAQNRARSRPRRCAASVGTCCSVWDLAVVHLVLGSPSRETQSQPGFVTSLSPQQSL